MVFFPQFRLFLCSLMGKILLPTRAEIDMPVPKTSQYGFGVLVIMTPELAVLTWVLCHTCIGFNYYANVILLCLITTPLTF